MKPLEEAPRELLRATRAVFFDIDDTFSGGAGQARILPEAYGALWRLKRAGIHAVPVTGRPAGWCDLIARMWPVSAVVGENGAFFAYLDESRRPSRLVKKYLDGPATRAANARKLARLRRAIARRFPGARVPSDQPFREFDLAIDCREDVTPWAEGRVDQLLAFCRAQGANAKLSSIHVNAWFGEYDKFSCVRRVLSRLFRMDFSRVVYIGDSPNDEPFFERLELTVGVANVRGFLGRMKHEPAYVTRAESGLGFAELVDRLLEARAS